MQNFDYCARVEDIMETNRFSVLKLDDEVQMELQTNCPCCDFELEKLCTLVNETGNQKMHYGFCHRCGYSGYIERPSQDWIQKFYNQHWDKFVKAESQIKNGFSLPKEGRKGSRYLAFSIHEKLQVDRNRMVCEVGSGYGEVLKNLELAGFKKLMGVEHSPHRAQLVNKIFGYPVLSGDFENEKVQSELRKLAPIGLFFSHHVLEHTYHPAQIISKMSELQNEGDHLILALPNGEGEHIFYTLFFLLHLHSFTKPSLEVLLNRYGYEVLVDHSPNSSNIVLGAKKVANPTPKFETNVKEYYEQVCQRIRNSLAGTANKGLFEVTWQESEEELDRKKFKTTIPAIGHLSWQLRKQYYRVKSRRFRRFSHQYKMLMRGGLPRMTGKAGAPMEVQFKNNIQFLIK